MIANITLLRGFTNESLLSQIHLEEFFPWTFAWKDGQFIRQRSIHESYLKTRHWLPFHVVKGDLSSNYYILLCG